ncbi:hypothetical protein P8C59_000853 [Phyllachora maydis]|nr:hypothetical protein P8C59_000853 [Phyllachora maydis]
MTEAETGTHRPRPAARTRLYPHVPLPPEAVRYWNTVVMPQVNTALRHFYRKSPESVEISLESIGESAARTVPTVLVVCTSVNKVRSILKKKLGQLFSETTGLALKVCRGQVLRSRNERPGRSMAGGHDAGDDEVVAANPGFQERPQNGASIGAWIGDRHLPPVSFGGMIVVDDEPYGMTVHHMLDDPEPQQPQPQPQHAWRSMAEPRDAPQHPTAWSAAQYSPAPESEEADSSGTEDSAYACEFSDTDSDASDSPITSDTSSDAGSDGSDDSDLGRRPQSYDPYAFDQPGDVPGIEPGCGAGYFVTQPALDDVAPGFYPNAATADEDHLDTYALGTMYASSGLRRRPDAATGLVHEIDWALFAFVDVRRPDGNAIPRTAADATKRAGKRLSTATTATAPVPVGESDRDSAAAAAAAILPTGVAPAASLPGLAVQCMARTSGLQTGLILPSLTSIKMVGRTSPCHTYQVTTSPPSPSPPAFLPMGLPGDSGAWLVHPPTGDLCGHVLAWSARKRVAYITPMEVLLRDVADALDAATVRLPGAPLPSVRRLSSASSAGRSSRRVSALSARSAAAASSSSSRQDPRSNKVSVLSDRTAARYSWRYSGRVSARWDGAEEQGEEREGAEKDDVDAATPEGPSRTGEGRGPRASGSGQRVPPYQEKRDSEMQLAGRGVSWGRWDARRRP